MVYFIFWILQWKLPSLTFAYDMQIYPEISPKLIKLNHAAHTHNMKYSNKSCVAVQSGYFGEDSSVLIWVTKQEKRCLSFSPYLSSLLPLIWDTYLKNKQIILCRQPRLCVDIKPTALSTETKHQFAHTTLGVVISQLLLDTERDI